MTIGRTKRVVGSKTQSMKGFKKPVRKGQKERLRGREIESTPPVQLTQMGGQMNVVAPKLIG